MRTRPNLRQALLHLRLPNLYRRLWIDAICINQGDNEEKANQIGFMRDIYKSATRTVVWLGAGDETTEGCFELAKRVSKIRDNFEFPPTNQRGPHILIHEYKALDIAENGAVAERSWEALSNIFTADWFSRVWVIQEVVSASWCVIMSGKSEASFFEIASVLAYVHKLNNEAGETGSNGFLDVWQGLYNMRASIGPSDGWGLSGVTLLDLLQRTRNFKATNPRDKIYAIMGVSNENSMTSEATFRAINPAGSLKVEYDKTTEEIYCDVTRCLILRNRGLEVLSMVHHTDLLHRDGFPSWVPRFDEPKKVPFNIGGMGVFSAAGTHRSQERFIRRTPDPTLLTVYGVRIDDVRLTSNTISFSSLKDFSPERIWSEISQADIYCPSSSHTYLTGEPLDLAFGMALTCGQIGALYYKSVMDGNGITNLNGETVGKLTTEFKASISAYKQLIIWRLTESGFRGSRETLIAESFREIVPFIGTVEVWGHGRRVFWTTSGRLGLGPSAMKPGDLVYSICGGRVPFVLRPCGNHFAFVGDVYVYDDHVMLGGYMNQHIQHMQKLDLR